MSRDICGVLVGDLHCGHIAGLTPPGQWKPEWAIEKPKLAMLHSETWNLWRKCTEAFKGCDVVVSNGDNIEGKGQRAGGNEVYEHDRIEQGKIAATCLSMFNAKQYHLTRGTPFHVGDDEEFENLMVNEFTLRNLECKIHNHLQMSLNGKVFDIKHHVGSSQIPYSEAMAVSRERVHNILWAERGACQKANYIIRSHVHYYAYAGNKFYRAMSLPALQAPYQTKYGRRCSRTIDWGMLPFEISTGGNVKWHEEWIVEGLESVKSELVVID